MPCIKCRKEKNRAAAARLATVQTKGGNGMGVKEGRGGKESCEGRGGASCGVWGVGTGS